MSGFYKVLNADLTSRNGGTYRWTVGEWAPEVDGDLVPCENGYHVCQESDLVDWLGPVICEAEIGGQVIRADNKTVARTARIVRVLPWNERTARLFAADCAERVLPLFEREHPEDNRPRVAIETARRFADGNATIEELADASDAALAAVWDASWRGDVRNTAAWRAARAATEAANAHAEEAAWAAAHAVEAVWIAAGYDAQYTERRWQTERLMAYLKGNE